MAPSLIICRICMRAGWKRSSWSMMASWPGAAWAAANISSASATESAMGFSQMTCLPACSAAIAISLCRCGGVTMLTMSTWGDSTTARQSS